MEKYKYLDTSFKFNLFKTTILVIIDIVLQVKQLSYYPSLS